MGQPDRTICPVHSGLQPRDRPDRMRYGRENSRHKGNPTMADHNKPDHVHGSMDIRDQEKTFDGFIRMTVWVVCAVIFILIFMALVNA
jgi:hypothetical protein